jgi:ABC-type transport system substrate-binding protein
MVNGAGPWGTGPYKLAAGFFTSEKRSEQVVLAANTDYWDRPRFPRPQRKAVNFVPYVNVLTLAETSVTADHWSVRKPKATVFK